MEKQTKETEIPQTLYKYRNWSDDYHKDVIKNDEIFFASPIHFNDPFDCKVITRADLESDDFIEKYMTSGFLKTKPNISKHELDNAVNFWMKKESWKEPRAVERYLKESQEFINKTGIFSLSAIKNNILMWSHYADSHKGYCVGFNTIKLDNYFVGYGELYKKALAIIKVVYYEKYPLFLTSDNKGLDFLIKPISSKAIDWGYEKEYRCYYHKNTDEVFKLPPNIIESVYLGCEMPLNDRHKILRILSTKPYRIKLYQASVEENNFGLQFTEVKF